MFHLDTLSTLVAATLVLLLGRKLVQTVPFLKKYTIPEPVAGGLLVALALGQLQEPAVAALTRSRPATEAELRVMAPVLAELGDTVFLDPDLTTEGFEAWQTADEYLSGHVRRKLAAARAAAARKRSMLSSGTAKTTSRGPSWASRSTGAPAATTMPGSASTPVITPSASATSMP